MKYLSYFSSLAVLIVAVAAFVLAFYNVEGLAVANGIPASRAWLVPVIVEGAMLALAFTRLEAELNRQDTRLLTLLIGAAVALSIALNWAHSNGRLWGVVIAVVQPVALLVSFESFMYQLRHRLARRQQGHANRWQVRARSLLTLAKSWRQCAKERLSKLDSLQADYAALLSRADKLQSRVNDLQTTKTENGRLQEENGHLQNQIATLQEVANTWQHMNQRAQIAALYNAGKFATLQEAANAAAVSESTVSRLASQMNGVAK